MSSIKISLALALLAPLAAPQKKEGREPRPELDPYTEAEPAAMEKAGYLSFGPFLWAGSATTEVVEETLGGVPLLWVETAHFRIGSSLDEIDLPEDRDQKKHLDKEIAELKQRIPLKKKPKKLDSWLRLHLFAMRLEKLYADFQETFGLSDDEFPSPAGARPNLGAGPYLGMRDKFVVLLTEKSSSLARFTGTFCDATVESSYRYFYEASDTLFFGMSMETLEGDYATDVGLTFGVVFGVTQNLTNGFRGYTHAGPVWYNLGIARYFARQVDTKILLYTASTAAAVRLNEEDTEWERKVRARVDHDFFPTMEEVISWPDYDDLEFNDHMMIWSRADFLLSLDQDVRRAFLMAMEEPVPWGGEGTREEALAKQFHDAIPAATGMDYAAFDEAWAAYVKKNYRKK